MTSFGSAVAVVPQTCGGRCSVLVLEASNPSARTVTTLPATRYATTVLDQASRLISVMKFTLPRRLPHQVSLEIKDPVDAVALEQAKAIIQELRSGGLTEEGGGSAVAAAAVSATKLQQVSHRLGDLPLTSSSFLISADACRSAYDALSEVEQQALTNVHRRIQAFALAQRQAIVDVQVDIPGGVAGHSVAPCQVAGCYAPGGRYPLPSSVLMTAVTARAAGCPTVVLASPKPTAITLAAAHLAGVDYFLAVGGAAAIAALAYGVVEDEQDNGTTTSTTGNPLLLPRCDVICGPGNQWVTAAKSLVNGHCGIDMLAGPSEVLVIADETANAQIVAADLLAQAEHDVVARAIVLCTSSDLLDQIDEQVAFQLSRLPEPNQSTARAALTQSFAVHCENGMEQCIALSDAEVLGDYGAGPNHTLPTGGTGRYTGGLSVFNFLRIRTYMRIDDTARCQDMVDDTIVMARLEGLEGHARAAETRSTRHTPAFQDTA
jgi:histidinol dehydrogenase